MIRWRPVRTWGLTLALLITLPGKSGADCPGCGAAILVVPLELVILDGVSTLAVYAGGSILGAEGRLGPTFIGGLWGGVAGFILGSLAGYTYYQEGGTAMGIGGAVAGLPLGVAVGTVVGFVRDARAEAGRREEFTSSGRALHLALAPMPKGGAVLLIAGF